MSERLTWGAWLKELRAELGREQGKARISQGELAVRLGMRRADGAGDQALVGKWEMTKKSGNQREPDRDNYIKLMDLASQKLRARAPRAPGPEIQPSGSDSGTLDDFALPGVTGKMTPETEDVVRLMESVDDVRARAAIRDAAFKKNGELLRRANPPAAVRASKP